MGHSCRTLLWDTLIGHSCGTLFWDTLVGPLLWDTLVPVGHSCRTLLWHTRSTPASVSYETSSKSHASRLRKTSVSFETFSKSHASSLQNERFVRDFLQKSHVKSPKRAFRTRLPPKVTRQVSKTSVSYETSSKFRASSLQNERFVRDFLQKSRCEAARRAFRTRLPPKVTRQVSKNERFARDFLQKSSGNTHRSTHITQPCLAISRFQPLQTTPAHTQIPM